MTTTAPTHTGTPRPARLYEPAAEQAIAACAAHSRTAALACTDRLNADHFHDPRCWAVIAAALHVPDQRPDELDPAGGWWREHLIADAAGIYRPLLEEWCRHAPAAWDTTGALADRVLVAAHARRRAGELVAELEHLGFGVQWEAAA